MGVCDRDTNACTHHSIVLNLKMTFICVCVPFQLLNLAELRENCVCVCMAESKGGMILLAVFLLLLFKPFPVGTFARKTGMMFLSFRWIIEK